MYHSILWGLRSNFWINMYLAQVVVWMKFHSSLSYFNLVRTSALSKDYLCWYYTDFCMSGMHMCITCHIYCLVNDQWKLWKYFLNYHKLDSRISDAYTGYLDFKGISHAFWKSNIQYSVLSKGKTFISFFKARLWCNIIAMVC